MRYIILVTIFLFSCSVNKHKDSKWKLTIKYDKRCVTYIYCDSISMSSKKEAYVWRDGVKTKIYANEILLESY